MSGEPSSTRYRYSLALARSSRAFAESTLLLGRAISLSLSLTQWPIPGKSQDMRSSWGDPSSTRQRHRLVHCHRDGSKGIDIMGRERGIWTGSRGNFGQLDAQDPEGAGAVLMGVDLGGNAAPSRIRGAPPVPLGGS